MTALSDTKATRAVATKAAQSVERIDVRQDNLEGRVTGVERDIQHMAATITELASALRTGFVEVHRSLDKQNEETALRGRTSWPLVIAAITLSLSIGVVFVSFVNMTVAPMRADDVETRLTLEKHVALPGHVEAIQKYTELAGRADTLDREVTALTAAQLANQTMFLTIAKTDGKVEQAYTHLHDDLKALRERVEAVRPDPFFGREGSELSARITTLETFLRDQAAANVSNQRSAGDP